MGFFTRIERIAVNLSQKFFSVTVQYEHWADAVVELEGVFSKEWVQQKGVTSVKPIVRIVQSELTKPPTNRDIVEIEEVRYRVLEWREDGHGGLILILNKV